MITIAPPTAKTTAGTADLPDPRTALLLGVPFHNVTMTETLDRIDALVSWRRPSYLATANLDFAEQVSRDVELQRILLEAELVLCDGTPLVWASRWLGAPLRERVAGSDMMPHLFARAAKMGHRLFFLGATAETLQTAVEKSVADFPGLKIAGTYAPPFARLLEIEHEEIVRRIHEAKPDILLVAMGCPKQEKWIFMHYRELGVPVSIGIGASLDFIAGKFRRAPMWARVCGAEWLFRLLQEPKRLIGRYFGDLLFFRRALRRQQRLLHAHGNLHHPPTRTEETAAEGYRRLRWAGAIDAGAVERDEVQPIHAEENEIVVLDAGGVTGIDSVGLGLLARSWRNCRENGGRLLILRPSAVMREALALTHLENQMPVMEDDDSLAAWLADHGRPARQQESEIIALELSGELTAATVKEYEQFLLTAWAQAPQARRLQLALSKVSFMDSSGLGLLVKVLKLTRQRPQGSLSLVAPSRNVLNVINLANLGSVLGVAPAR